MPTERVISIYVRWQDQLRAYGDTQAATDAFFELCRLIEHDPFLDSQGFESVLERLHALAYPQASTRPPRLHAGELADIRE